MNIYTLIHKYLDKCNYIVELSIIDKYISIQIYSDIIIQYRIAEIFLNYMCKYSNIYK